MAIKGNINDPIWVKLTEDGKRIHNEHYANILKNSKVQIDLKNYEPKIDRKGLTRYTLWEWASIFGPSLHHGMMVQPFTDNIVYYDEP
ncbi:MAG TPA: hypothetical protein VL576_00275 [Candidatus Paceibacterota bacterium]|jgi:hypothetical protein|nr:hypothetical protein [Candidatus Paceibacterota bacterium]